jgi:hypothetical protein
MAGFSDLANDLQPPDFASGGAKLPKVSGAYLKYSRFWETAAGGRVRSALCGGACTATQPIQACASYLLAVPTRGEPGQLRLERLGDLPPGVSL